MGDDVEYVRLNADNSFSMSMEGMATIKQLPYNFLLETTSSYQPIQVTRGTVVFMRTKHIEETDDIWDYELEDVTDEDIEILKKMLDRNYQLRLKSLILSENA